MKVTYRLLSKFYDLIDVIYFRENGINPRKAIKNMIPNSNVAILDMCCGTLSNSIEIAKVRKNAKLVGIDISDDMIEVAKEKVRKQHLKNVSVEHQDATATSYEDSSFDYVILALVLHETEESLANEMLNEVKRLLKSDGRLLVLEWEKSKSLWRRLVFFPVKMMEPKPFKAFFTRNKREYFKKHGFTTTKIRHCDYSCVLELKSQ